MEEKKNKFVIPKIIWWSYCTLVATAFCVLMMLASIEARELDIIIGLGLLACLFFSVWRLLVNLKILRSTEFVALREKCRGEKRIRKQKKKKISYWTALKVALWWIAVVFMALVYMGTLQDGFFSQPAVTGALFLLIAVWRLRVNCRIYRSPEFQEMQRKAREEREIRLEEERRQKERYPEVFSEMNRSKTKKSRMSAGKAVGLGVFAVGYVTLGVIFELMNRREPIFKKRRRRR